MINGFHYVPFPKMYTSQYLHLILFMLYLFCNSASRKQCKSLNMLVTIYQNPYPWTRWYFIKRVKISVADSFLASFVHDFITTYVLSVQESKLTIMYTEEIFQNGRQKWVSFFNHHVHVFYVQMGKNETLNIV